MESHKICMTKENMLCHTCMLHVIRSLSRLPGIEELNVDLDAKKIEITYKGRKIPQEKW